MNNPATSAPIAEQLQSRFPSTSSSIAALRSLAIPVETILDVGVQHGSPELCKSCPDLPHILFEPVGEYRNNIAYNYRDIRHELVEAAVSDQDGEAELAVSSVIPGFSVSHASIVDPEAPPGQTDGEIRIVPRVTLDGFLSKRPDIADPFLLKIDIDGLELKVLAGAEETLPRCSIVVIEMNILRSFPERYDFLRRAGFRLMDIVDLAYYGGILRQVDEWWFVRNDLTHLLQIKGLFDFNGWQVLAP